MKTISIVIVKPSEEPKTIKINDELESFQKMIDGYIEVVSVTSLEGIAMIVNEEGKIKNLPFNRYIGGDPIAGTMFFTKIDKEGDFENLTEDDIEKIHEFLEKEKTGT